MSTFTSAEFSDLLRSHIKAHYKRQIHAATAWDVSAAFVSGVLKGHKRPTQIMLDEIGFERVVSYRPKGKV